MRLGAVLIDAGSDQAGGRRTRNPRARGRRRRLRAGRVLAPDSGLDRPELGSIVFADPEKLAVLNSIVHPLVGARSASWRAPRARTPS